MPVDQLNDKVVLKNSKVRIYVTGCLPTNRLQGSTVELLYYGATVISWNVNGVERLFVSSRASIDGSRPVRGGIPVVFPCFGAPTHPEHAKLPQHGFARSERWTFDSIVMDNDAGVSVRLSSYSATQVYQDIQPILQRLGRQTLSDSSTDGSSNLLMSLPWQNIN